MSQDTSTTRRQFLGRGAAAAIAAGSAPYFVSPSALGLETRQAASERIVVGCIGLGGKGQDNMLRFASMPDVQIVAVCDVDQNHAQQAAEKLAQQRPGNVAVLHDFRELVARDDLDAVSVATPDHWHALTSVAALNAGKDVYCEKPLANSVGEGRAICQAAERNGRIVQTGSHERSNPNARLACELVRNGRIGKLTSIEVNLPVNDPHHQEVRAFQGMPQGEAPPAHFDYDFWLGPAPSEPYTARRCHFWWRFILSYGGGEMTDRGAHIIDLAQLGAAMDASGPVKIQATGTRSAHGLYNAFMDFEFDNTYASGLKLIGRTVEPRGLKFVGDRGWIFLHVHGCKMEMEIDSFHPREIQSGMTDLQLSPGHRRNFIDCVKSRAQPMAPAEVGHRTATICHLNNIAMLVERPLTWDPEQEQIVGDLEASKLLTPEMRSPWRL